MHPLDVIDIYCPTSFVERDTARDLPWNIAVFYRHLRDPDGIPYCSAEGLEDWAEYVVTDESGEVSQYSIRPEPKGLCDAPKQFANTHDHWTQTLRRVWRPEIDEIGAMTPHDRSRLSPVDGNAYVDVKLVNGTCDYDRLAGLVNWLDVGYYRVIGSADRNRREDA